MREHVLISFRGPNQGSAKGRYKSSSDSYRSAGEELPVTNVPYRHVHSPGGGRAARVVTRRRLPRPRMKAMLEKNNIFFKRMKRKRKEKKAFE